jgi:hypothetical protein
MTTTTAPAQTNPFSSILDSAKSALESLVGGTQTILAFNGSVYLKDGKLFIQTSEQIGPASLSQPPLELDPAAVWAMCSKGVGGTFAHLFGKK